MCKYFENNDLGKIAAFPTIDSLSSTITSDTKEAFLGNNYCCLIQL